jgi:subtilisin family serine protease
MVEKEDRMVHGKAFAHAHSDRSVVRSGTSAVVEQMERRVLLAGDQLGARSIIDWNDQRVEVVAGEWVVGFKSPEPTRDDRGEIVESNIQYRRGSVSTAGLRVALAALSIPVTSAAYLGVEHMIKVTVGSQLVPDAVASALRTLPDVVSVEPNVIGHIAAFTPNDTLFGNQWWHDTIVSHGTGGGSGAWDFTTGASSTVVAVLDSGVNYNHQDLAPNRWENSLEVQNNDVDDDGNGYVDDYYGYDFVSTDRTPLDELGHGTAVAGIIAAAGNNGIGVTGVSMKSRVLAVRIADTAGNVSLADAIDGIQYVGGLRDVGVNVRVINASWRFIGLSSSDVSALSSAISDVAAQQVLVVAAAGNDYADLDSSLDVYPAELTNNNLITVAASTSTDGKASFSNWGKTSVDLAAPGESIYTTTYPGNASYGSAGSGTSFSAPMVAGTAALLLSMNPDLTYTEVRNAILNNVDIIPAWNDPNGDGNNSDRLVATGGRLNARRAIAAISPGFTRTIVGDPQGAPVADSYHIRTKPGDSTRTQIQQYISGTWTVLTEIDNVASQKIGIYSLYGNDAQSIDSGVNNALYLSGYGGNDTFNGGNGNDTIRGGGGADSVRGGSGNDVFYMRYSTAGATNDPDIIFGDAGSDWAIVDAGDTYSSIETLITT